MILEEEMLEEISDQIRFKEDRISEDIKEIIGMKILNEAEVGLERGSFKITSEEMTEIIMVGLDQKPVLTERELDVISVGRMIISQKTDFKIRKRNRTGTTNV